MLRRESYPGQTELANRYMKELPRLREAYLETLTTRIVILEDGQGVLGKGEMCPVMGAELVMEDERGGIDQGASGTRSVGTQTEGTGAVTHLALGLVVACGAVNGRVVGAEVRRLP